MEAASRTPESVPVAGADPVPRPDPGPTRPSGPFVGKIGRSGGARSVLQTVAEETSDLRLASAVAHG